MTASHIARVEYTDNFEANLAEIEQFWQLNHRAIEYDHLLERLLHTVVPSLEQYPELGKQFLSQDDGRADPLLVLITTSSHLDKLRELVFDNYVLLYLFDTSAGAKSPSIQLIAIKHHKQLAFNFTTH